MLSVHPFAAVNGTTVAGDLVLIIFKIKLIVVTELEKIRAGIKLHRRGARMFTITLTNVLYIP